MTTLRNSVQLIGRLGTEPETKTFGDNKTMVKFSFATSSYYKDKDGERVEETQWHNIVAWGGTATIAEKYLKKGQEIAISGKITYRSWDDKDGNKKYFTEIVANEFVMFNNKK
jgi:single-strand DNA-binding protein